MRVSIQTLVHTQTCTHVRAYFLIILETWNICDTIYTDLLTCECPFRHSCTHKQARSTHVRAYLLIVLETWNICDAFYNDLLTWECPFTRAHTHTRTHMNARAYFLIILLMNRLQNLSRVTTARQYDGCAKREKHLNNDKLCCRHLTNC